MKLTNFTDYSLRTLMYLAVFPDRLCTVREISKYFDISQNHMVKVVHNLSKSGYIDTKKGKGGGITLAQHANEIDIGTAVKHIEPNFYLADCFKVQSNNCKIECKIKPACRLKDIFFSAYQAFINELDQHTLADLTASNKELQELMRQDP